MEPHLDRESKQSVTETLDGMELDGEEGMERRELANKVDKV